MKKLLFLAVLLGLTGCGETDQNDTSQATLQSPVTASAMQVNYRIAASPSAMSASATSFGGWNPLGLKPVGASSLLNASKTLGGIATDSHALITPAVKDVTKVLVRGAGGLALSVAIEELLGAVDWVMDPANNQIRYKVDPTDPSEQETQCKKVFFISEGTKKIQTCNLQDACDQVILHVNSLGNGYKYSFNGITGTVSGYCNVKMTNIRTGQVETGGFSYLLISNPNYNPNAEPEEKTLPLDVVSQEIINNAESGNADAQAVTLAAAQAIVSEAENDAEKAEPIVRELDDNSTNKCPSGITNNGSCWICSRESWAPIRGRVVYAKDVVFGLSKCSAAMNSSQLLTRYKAFSELGAARDAENSCWAPQDQNHLQEAVEAKQTAAECNTYLGILGQ